MGQGRGAASRGRVVHLAPSSSAAHGALCLDPFSQHPHAARPCLAAAQDVPGVPAGVTKLLAVGTQTVSKGREGPEAANRVHVQVAALRLPDHGADLLISLNTAVDISSASAAAVDAGAGRPAGAGGAGALFGAMVRTLVVKDWGLFG